MRCPLWSAVPLLLLVACGDPAQFRPAKGVAEYPSTKDAYRVQEPSEDCTELGFIIRASRIADIAETAANHGGTHYLVLNDQTATSLETSGSASQSFGVVYAHSSTYAVKHHSFTARVYRC